MRADRAATGIFTATIVLTVLALPTVVRADPPDAPPPAPTAPDAPPPTLHEAAPPAPRPRVVIEVPLVLKDTLVVVKARRGPIEGKLVSIEDDRITLTAYNGQPIEIDRTDVLAIRPLFMPGSGPAPATRDPGRPAPVTPPEPETDDAPSTHDSELPPLSHEEEVAERIESARVSPWGLWGMLALGPAWGDASGRRVAPAAVLSFDLAVAYHFVYVGAGMTVTMFGGAHSFTNETTGGTLSSGVPASFSGYGEAGLAKGLFFPYSSTHSIEVRPGVAYGLLAMTDASQGIGNCVGCDTRSFKYNGAQYVRLQVGVFNAAHADTSLVNHVFMSDNGVFIGGTASLQEFVVGASPRLHHVLSFGLTGGWGR
jgi:hypothetical protein